MSRTLPKYVIITSDDFGYSAERDAGIVQCYKHGAVTCASVMMNGYNVISAVEQAAKLGMPIDLHLNLTEGRPVGKACSSLTDEDGFMLGKMGLRAAMENKYIDFKEVKEEIQVQIDKYHKLTGEPPVKVDGHQHVHIIPGICEAFSEVLEFNSIKMSRLPIEDSITSHNWSSQQQLEFVEGVVNQSRIAHEVFAKHGIWAPRFVGLKTFGKDMTSQQLQACITAALSRHYRNSKSRITADNSRALTSHSVVTDYVQSSSVKEDVLPGIVCELMVHPGNRTGSVGGCGNGPDDFSQSLDREHEKAILMSEDMLEFYKACGISLIAFRDCIGKKIKI